MMRAMIIIIIKIIMTIMNIKIIMVRGGRVSGLVRRPKGEG